MKVKLTSKEMSYCFWYAEKYEVPVEEVIQHEVFTKEVRMGNAKRKRPTPSWLGKPNG